MDLLIEEFNKNLHDRSSFDCGIDELNLFLKLHANQNQLKNVSKSYVTFLSNDSKIPKNILGYYTLASGQINCSDLPISIKEKLPRHPVPIARIGRLAVDKRFQGKGIGGYLLYNALKNIIDVSRTIGIFAVIVDAKNAHVEMFYKNFGFTELQNSGRTLFLGIDTIKSASLVPASSSAKELIYD